MKSFDVVLAFFLAHVVIVISRVIALVVLINWMIGYTSCHVRDLNVLQ